MSGLGIGRDKGETRISHLVLSSSKTELGLDEPLSLNVAFKVVGAFRESFHDANWRRAHEAHDIKLRLNYELEILKKRTLSYASLTKLHFVRRATFYWSRDPAHAEGRLGFQSRVWAMIVTEDGEPHIPRDLEEARELFFDANKRVELMGSDLGRGEHILMARVRAKWWRHTFIDEGEVRASSNTLKLRVS